MMRARCLAYAVRALFPEVLSGIYTDLEIQDVMPAEDVTIELNEEGEVIINQNVE